MNRWFNKCLVHLMLALVNFPIWYQPIAILNAQPVEITEEEFTTAEELKQSNEQLILPDMTDVDKQEPIFSFEKEVLQGAVDEILLLTFFSDQTVGDISLKIPEAVKINENDLDANMAIYSRDTDQEWLLSTSKKQKQFTIPLSVDKPGSYSVVVANQAEVTLKISGEEPQDEEMLTNEAEIEVTDGQVYEDNIRSDQLRNNVGIRDFELTGIVDNEDDFHLVPIGTVPLRVSDQTQVYYNGQLQTGLFDIQQAQLGNAEIRITNLGSYRGESVEVIFDKFNTNGPLSSLRVHQSNDNIQWQIIRNNNQEEAAISMNQTTRIMETKEIIGSPVIQGMMQYFQNNSFFQIKQSALHSVLLLDTYDGDVTVRSINSDFEFNMGTGTLTTLDPNKMSSFIVDSDVEFKFSFPEQAVLSYGIALFGWPGEELFPLYNINTEASPAIGGNPIIDTASLWQGSTTEIRANPATGYTFSRWEIVSGTGSSIANVNAANTTFTMGSSNTTIRAVYTQNTYNLTVQASPAAGGNPTAGSGTVAQGSTTEIRANPATGYTFSRWEIVSGTGSSIANVNAANTTFTMGSSNTTIRAVYTQNTYNLTVQASPAAGGNPTAGSGTVAQGSTTEIRANPATGYTFSRWEIVSGTGSSIANVNAANTTFTMGSSNTTIRAVYTQNMYSLNVQASPAAGGNPTVGSGTVAQGATTEIRANPATGYTFSRWEIVSGTGSSIANVNAANTTFTMGSSNTTIRAVYTQNTYSVTVVPVPSDGGRPSASREVFDLTNHMIYFDAAPSEGYRFVKYELIEGSTSMWWDPYDDMPIIVFDLSDVIMHVHYEKISAAEVEVNYIDLDQNKIASSVILTGALGDNYETEPKDIEGYLLVETPENANGIFTENNQTVEYVYDTEKVTPVDPVKPEEKVDPDDKPLITENQGLLSIDFVSQFRFSEQVISVDDAIYYAHSQKLLNEDGQIREENRPNYVQISDRRVQDDSDVGWSLSLVQKEQFQTTYGQELLGARLILSDQQLDTATNNLAPTILEEEDLELVPGVKQTLVSAQKGQGKGTWIYRFGDEDTAENSVRLVIPAKTMPKATTYTSTLVWELSMVPAVPVENR
ncbi:InlB B-repeat-containing protein [Enterococcus sp.]|uniref:InlB B-repeat-containing protein n=1 Tax=Enterococcus sp. TaxID=35783 RepID=UPI0028A894EE|nr:WxL domain-containing protein [Enterococcus sp.]